MLIHVGRLRTGCYLASPGAPVERVSRLQWALPSCPIISALLSTNAVARQLLLAVHHLPSLVIVLASDRSGHGPLRGLLEGRSSVVVRRLLLLAHGNLQVNVQPCAVAWLAQLLITGARNLLAAKELLPTDLLRLYILLRLKLATARLEGLLLRIREAGIDLDGRILGLFLRIGRHIELAAHR